MSKVDVVIIGAGAAGLAAAYELSLLGKKVVVLEARDRPGGRIHSIRDERFNNTIETGAEFIHGKLPYTLSLLNKAGIHHHVSSGKMYRVYKGKLQKTDEFINGWDEVMDELKRLPDDMSIADFLNHYFAGEEHKELRDSMIGYVEGYDAADATRASSFALRKEWEAEEEEQGRIDNGYGELVNYLADECKKRGGKILLCHKVSQINWRRDNVEVITANAQTFYAQKAIITLPLGIWQRMETESIVSFKPELPHKVAAAQQMGFGGVIKFNFQFSTPFWEDEIPNKMKNAGFILSDAEIPTWWTQNPKDTCILTGWIAGPRTTALKELSEEQLLQKAVHSLASIFSVHEQYILNRLKAHVISNWLFDPYSLGAYSYPTLQTAKAKKVLSEPVEDTLFFAGEALYEGTETGTVEGALVSGREVARGMI